MRRIRKLLSRCAFGNQTTSAEKHSCHNSGLSGAMYVGIRMKLSMHQHVVRAVGLVATVAFSATLLCAPLGMAAQAPSAQIEQLYAEAQQAQQAENYAVAEQLYKRIVQMRPALGPAYNNLGRVYFNQGRYSDAIATLTRGLAVQPNMVPAKVMLGASLLETGQAHKAVAPLEAAVAALPSDRFARVTLVRSLIADDQPEAALVHLQAMLHMDPKDQEAWYLSGKIHLQLAQMDLAQVQAIDDKSALAQIMAGEIMESMQNTPGAVAAYKQAVAAEGETSNDAIQHLAHLYWSTSDWVNAKAQYATLVSREPGNCIARWRGAESRIELAEDSPEILTDLSTALTQCPNLAQAHADRAGLLLRSGKPQQALVDLKAAEAEAPDEPTVQQLMAQAYRALGDRAQAEAANRKFSELQARMHQSAEDRARAVVRANQ